jgi:thioredoxin reductase (NADPH)
MRLPGTESMTLPEKISDSAPIECDAVIVGAGPCGLFQVFELGLLGIHAHIVDSLQNPGGQCAELYPDKPIYDIPALPVCGAQELIDRLLQQIKPFEPTFHLGQEVTEVRPLDDGRFHVRTAVDTVFHTRVIVIAGGVGAFQPRKLAVPGAEVFEGRGIHYRVRSAAEFHSQDLVIFGGGDSALDWTLDLCGKAKSLTLVHRRAEFRAAPASVARMHELVAAGQMRYVEGTASALIIEGDQLAGVEIKGTDGALHKLPAGQLLAFFGLRPQLGPIAGWGLDLDKRNIKVDTGKFQTNVPGIFAVGDISTYPGKKKLILSGFHEAALAAFAIQHHISPEKKQFLQYTTTSPLMQKRLGVAPQ